MRDNTRKIGKSVRPWCISNWMSFTWPYCLALCSFGPPSRALVVITWRGVGCRYMMRLGKTGKRAQVSSVWAKGCMLMTVCVCVLSDLTWLLLLGGGRKSWYIITNQIIVLVLWHYKNNNIIRISVLLTYSDVEAVLCKLPCPAAWSGDSESLSRLLSVRSLGRSAHNISNTVRSLAQIITYRVAHFTKVKYWQYKLLLNGLLEHI